MLIWQVTFDYNNRKQVAFFPHDLHGVCCLQRSRERHVRCQLAEFVS